MPKVKKKKRRRIKILARTKMNPLCFTEPTSSAWKLDHDGAYATIICDYPQVIGKVLLLQPPSSTSRIPFMSLQREMVLDLETLEAHSSLSKWFDALKHRVNTTHCHLSPLEPWDMRENGDGSRFLGILQAWERARSAKKRREQEEINPQSSCLEGNLYQGEKDTMYW